MMTPTKADIARDLAILATHPGTLARAKAEAQPTVQVPVRQPSVMPGSVADGGPHCRTDGRADPRGRVEYQ